MIVFIPCGSKKANFPCEAQHMYLGGYFSKCLEYAKTLTEPQYIYIISAKYGVLSLTEKIEPYNVHLTDTSKEYKKVWYELVNEQLKIKFNPLDEVALLTPKPYNKPLLKYFNNVNMLLKDCHGMGYSMEFMKKEIEKYKENNK